jgi:hypothetical protein
MRSGLIFRRERPGLPQRMLEPSSYRCSNLSQMKFSLVRLGSRFSVCFPCILGVHLDTSKVERVTFSLSGEAFFSEAWHLGDLVYKV